MYQVEDVRHVDLVSHCVLFSIISEIYGRLIDGGTLRRSDAAVATLRAHRSHRSADVLCFKLLSLPLLLLAFFRITVLWWMAVVLGKCGGERSAWRDLSAGRAVSRIRLNASVHWVVRQLAFLWRPRQSHQSRPWSAVKVHFRLKHCPQLSTWKMFPCKQRAAELTVCQIESHLATLNSPKIDRQQNYSSKSSLQGKSFF